MPTHTDLDTHSHAHTHSHTPIPTQTDTHLMKLNTKLIALNPIFIFYVTLTLVLRGLKYNYLTLFCPKVLSRLLLNYAIPTGLRY